MRLPARLPTIRPILVADEPTGNLDSRTAEAVFGLFTEAVGAGKTVVMVTHDMELAQRAGRVLRIADGQFVHATEPVAEVA